MQLALQNQTLSNDVDLSSGHTLADVISGLAPGWDAHWCWDNYKPLVKRLARILDLTRLCEIGGGRSPLFTKEEMREIGGKLSVNDISQSELDRGPGGYRTLCLDIAGDLGTAPPEQFDLMFSQMVFEHLRDTKRAWRNIHTLLRPGGVALAFFPTLYAWPFVINRAVPDDVTGPILRALFPNRNDGGKQPKFPAYYDHCFGDGRKLQPLLEDIGFREHHVLPFWGHDYLRRIPVARHIDNAFNRMAARMNWTQFTSYAYVLVRK